MIINITNAFLSSVIESHIIIDENVADMNIACDDIVSKAVWLFAGTQEQFLHGKVFESPWVRAHSQSIFPTGNPREDGHHDDALFLVYCTAIDNKTIIHFPSRSGKENVDISALFHFSFDSKKARYEEALSTLMDTRHYGDTGDLILAVLDASLRLYQGHENVIHRNLCNIVLDISRIISNQRDEICNFDIGRRLYKSKWLMRLDWRKPEILSPTPCFTKRLDIISHDIMERGKDIARILHQCSPNAHAIIINECLSRLGNPSTLHVPSSAHERIAGLKTLESILDISKDLRFS